MLAWKNASPFISVPFWQLSCGIYSCSPYSSLEDMLVDHTKQRQRERQKKEVGCLEYPGEALIYPSKIAVSPRPSPDKTYPGEAREARRNSCFHHRQALIFKHAIKIIKMSSYALLTLSLSPSAWVSFCLSDPAKSTRWSRDTLILAIPALRSWMKWQEYTMFLTNNIDTKIIRKWQHTMKSVNANRSLITSSHTT